MAGIGPPPTPLKVLQARGSWRAQELKNTLQPEPGVPAMPESMPEDAKEIWRVMVPVMERMGVLCPGDASALEVYCWTFALWRRAAKEVDQKGTWYEKSKKTRRSEETSKKLFPGFRAFIELSTQLSHLEAVFGLTPASRSRITKTEPKVEKDGKRSYLKLA